MDDFQPRIIGFLCNWCTAAAADLAGQTRMALPPGLRPIRVQCSGSVDPTYIVKALLAGADGVFVGGCHPGDCHYVSGNLKTRRRISTLKTILKTLGLPEERVQLRWIHASEGRKYADTVNAMAESIKELGPTPIGPSSFA